MRSMIGVLFVLVLSWPMVGAAQTLPERVFDSFNAMRGDAQAVVSAIVDRLQGGAKPVAAVRFASTVGPAPAGDTYAGFTWRAASLFRYDVGDTDATRLVSGLLEFDDALGRRAAVLFEGDYALAGNALEVSGVTVASHFLEKARSAMFVLPADELTGASGPVPEGHAALFQFAQQHAVSWDRPDDVVAGERDYAIVVFLLDRVSPSAKFEVKLSDKTRTSCRARSPASCSTAWSGSSRFSAPCRRPAKSRCRVKAPTSLAPGPVRSTAKRQAESSTPPSTSKPAAANGPPSGSTNS